MSNIVSAKPVANVSWGISYWEVHAYNEAGKVEKMMNLSLHFAKKNEITKTLRGTKKLTSWLNSEEGLKMVREQEGQWLA